MGHVGSSSQTRVEHGPPALGAWTLSHWTTRESPVFFRTTGEMLTPGPQVLIDEGVTGHLTLAHSHLPPLFPHSPALCKFGAGHFSQHPYPHNPKKYLMVEMTPVHVEGCASALSPPLATPSPLPVPPAVGIVPLHCPPWQSGGLGRAVSLSHACHLCEAPQPTVPVDLSATGCWALARFVAAAGKYLPPGAGPSAPQGHSGLVPLSSCPAGVVWLLRWG